MPEGVSPEEQRFAADVIAELGIAHERLEAAEGPADELNARGLVNVLDDVTEAKKMVGSALRKLQMIQDDS